MTKTRQWKLNMPPCVTIHQAHVQRGVKTKEEDEQVAFFDIVRQFQDRFPMLRRLFHVPNQGTGSAALGRKRKRMGVVPGGWDIQCLSPSKEIRGTYGSMRYFRLLIEMKVGTNGLSDDQLDWANYYVTLPGESRLAVCYSGLDRWDVTNDYFGLGVSREEVRYGRYARLSGLPNG